MDKLHKAVDTVVRAKAVVPVDDGQVVQSVKPGCDCSYAVKGEMVAQVRELVADS